MSSQELIRHVDATFDRIPRDRDATHTAMCEELYNMKDILKMTMKQLGSTKRRCEAMGRALATSDTVWQEESLRSSNVEVYQGHKRQWCDD